MVHKDPPLCVNSLSHLCCSPCSNSRSCELALEGCCPVALLQGGPSGDSVLLRPTSIYHCVEFDGAVYRCASAKAAAAMYQSPILFQETEEGR